MESCRILMIVGATGSGKTRLLRSLAGCAASLRSRPRWPSGRSILDGLGADGAARSGAVGADGAWPMADGGAADGGAAAVRRCGERRCGDGDGGAATAVRREALLAGSSLSPLTLPRRSISRCWVLRSCSLLVLQRPRPRLAAPGAPGWQEEEQSVRDP